MYFPKDDFAIPASFIVFVLLARTTRRVVYLEAGSHIQMSLSAHDRGSQISADQDAHLIPNKVSLS
jgi:hypothetical protein